MVAGGREIIGGAGDNLFIARSWTLGRFSGSIGNSTADCKVTMFFGFGRFDPPRKRAHQPRPGLALRIGTTPPAAGEKLRLETICGDCQAQRRHSQRVADVGRNGQSG